MKEIAKILKQAMIQRDISSYEMLAARTGIHESVVGRLMRGESSAKIVNVLKCAEALGVDVKFIIRGE